MRRYFQVVCVLVAALGMAAVFWLVVHAQNKPALQQVPIAAGSVPDTVAARNTAKPDAPHPKSDRPALLVAPFTESEAAQKRSAWSGYTGKPDTVESAIGGHFVLIPPGE